MKLKLNEYWIKKLLSYPETGMGYQRVDVILKSGKVIRNIIALNAEELDFPEDFSDMKLEEIVDLIADFIQTLLNCKLQTSNPQLLKFTHKNYTLLSDRQVNKHLLVIFDFYDWPENFGGYISIISNNQEIARLNHAENSLSIIHLPTPGLPELLFPSLLQNL